jgi:ferritin-like metal-binding protein YciE
MANAATDPELKKGFEDHLEETKNHVTRLEEIHGILGEKPKKLACEGIRGIIEDGEWVSKHVEGLEAKDANLARAAQYAEHYEIAGYMGAIAWAEELKQPKIVALLEQTLSEEIKGDSSLGALGRKLDQKVSGIPEQTGSVV